MIEGTLCRYLFYKGQLRDPFVTAALGGRGFWLSDRGEIVDLLSEQST
jgi:hypothetical protein